MKKTRRRYDRDFKISKVAELDGGKSPDQIARSTESIKAFPPFGETSW